MIVFGAITGCGISRQGGRRVAQADVDVKGVEVAVGLFPVAGVRLCVVVVLFCSTNQTQAKVTSDTAGTRTAIADSAVSRNDR